MARRTRGPMLTAAAILFGMLALSDLLKPFRLLGGQTGFVFLGERQQGTPNAIFGAVFGVYLLTYGWSIWNMRRLALSLGRLYAAYVMVNVVLFPFRTPPPPDAGPGYLVFGVVYAAIAIGVSVGTWFLLARRRNELT